MSNDSNTAFAAGVYQSHNNSALESIRKEYANEKYHDFNIVQEDSLARRAEYRAKLEHESRLAVEQSITQLTEQIADLKRNGEIEAAKSKEIEINDLRRTNHSDGFDTDHLTMNFAATLDEITESFGDATRDEMKTSIMRMSALMDSIEASNAVEKDFLLEQYRQTQEHMQSEFNKRANIAARATEKMAEMGEQYLDVKSLYSGFVDHNPIMMTLFNMGADFIRKQRHIKKTQREAIERDKKNQAHAEKINAEKQINAEIERMREDELYKQQQETLKAQRSSIEETNKSKKQTKASTSVKDDKTVNTSTDNETVITEVDGFDASEFFNGIPSDDDTGEGFSPADIFDGIQADEGFERDESQVIEFPVDEFSNTGDAELSPDIMQQMLDGVGSDENDALYTVETNYDPAPVIVNNTDPIIVKQGEETPEQKAQAMFVRQDAAEKQRNLDEHQNEQRLFDEKLYDKLVDIEDVLKRGNKFTKENGKAIKDSDGGLFGGMGGLVGLLGLDRVAGLFKGPITKALMLFAPAVAGISAVLSKVGLGGAADKLTDGFDSVVDKVSDKPDVDKKDKPSRKPTKTVKPKAGAKPGIFSRIATGAGSLLSGAGSLIGGAAKAGGGFLRSVGGMASNAVTAAKPMIEKAGGLAARGGAALLGTTTGALAASGAVGYGAGKLINDHVLSDDTKQGIGDFIGPKIDSVLSFFGNAEAERRMELKDRLESHNSKTLGLAAMTEKSYKEVPGEVSAMSKQDSKGNQLIVNAEKIDSEVNIDTKGIDDIEVPVSPSSMQSLQALEEGIYGVKEAEQKANQPIPVPITQSKPSRQTMVQSMPENTPAVSSRSARNDDSSIQRLTDRFVGMGMGG